jgi:hypothetical protein
MDVEDLCGQSVVPVLQLGEVEDFQLHVTKTQRWFRRELSLSRYTIFGCIEVGV